MDTTPAQKPRRIVGRETIEPSRLSPSARLLFGKRLYSIHTEIFAGVSEQNFFEHVIDPPAERTKVQVYHGKNGGLVGYCALHRFIRSIRDRETIVLRVEAGLRPEYRGRGTAHWFGMIGALIEKLRHPLTPVYYLGTLVHPSSYRFFSKYFPRVYPHPAHGMPEKIEALTLELAASFPDPPVDPADPLVRRVGWITIEESPDQALSAQENPPDVQYFKARNPGYPEGHGLVVLVPVTFSNVTRAILRRIAEILRQRLGARLRLR